MKKTSFIAVTELKDYLTPEFLEKLTLTDQSKVDIILAGKCHSVNSLCNQDWGQYNYLSTARMSSVL